MLDSIYRDSRNRVIDLVSALDAAQLRCRVPATPDWTVHQLLAHLVGGAADAACGRVDGAGGDEWTARHVAERRDRPVSALVAEWQLVAPVIDASLIGRRFTGPGLAPDLICHEADLREALGMAPSPRAHWHDPFLPTLMALLRMRLTPITAITIRDDCGCEWGCNTTENTGTLCVDGYELLRAMFSRRTRRQIAAWPWPQPPSAAVIDSFGVFGPPADPQL